MCQIQSLLQLPLLILSTETLVVRHGPLEFRLVPPKLLLVHTPKGTISLKAPMVQWLLSVMNQYQMI